MTTICPSQAEIVAFENMPKEERMKLLRDCLLPSKIEFMLCQQCVLPTPLEYVRSIPLSHKENQQKVNTELWEQWNIADHERMMNGPYESEKDIYSAGVERLRDPNGVPPSLSMHYSVCSRRWGQEQQCFINARIGDIFFVKNGTGSWDKSGVLISYALERVDEPRRWNKYCVHHLASERFQDVIRAYNEANIVSADVIADISDDD
jgi:hypothetical protein